MNNAVFWDVAPCSFSLAGSSTLKMEAIRSSETSVHTKTTLHHTSENGILPSLKFSKEFNTKHAATFPHYRELHV
jgi:hypothetical protein